jgi:hypothetical protein
MGTADGLIPKRKLLLPSVSEAAHYSWRYMTFLLFRVQSFRPSYVYIVKSRFEFRGDVGFPGHIMYSSSFVNLRGLFNKILYSVFIYIDVMKRGQNYKQPFRVHISAESALLWRLLLMAIPVLYKISGYYVYLRVWEFNCYLLNVEYCHYKYTIICLQYLSLAAIKTTNYV